MSDFSDLCPLFNTGMYGELHLSQVALTSKTTSDILFALPAFGRSVIVTDFHVNKLTTFAGTCTALKVVLYKGASLTTTIGAQTAFASITLSSSITAYPINHYFQGTTTDKTFSATDVLFAHTNKSEAGAKTVNVLIRYKEK